MGRRDEGGGRRSVGLRMTEMKRWTDSAGNESNIKRDDLPPPEHPVALGLKPAHR